MSMTFQNNVTNNHEKSEGEIWWETLLRFIMIQVQRNDALPQKINKLM